LTTDKQPDVAMDKSARAHAAADADDIARLRSLSDAEQSRLVEPACEAPAMIYRSWLAEGLGDVEPAPWPPQENAPSRRTRSTARRGG
jgi:hypothetical protein